MVNLEALLLMDRSREQQQTESVVASRSPTKGVLMAARRMGEVLVWSHSSGSGSQNVSTFFTKPPAFIRSSLEE